MLLVSWVVSYTNTPKAPSSSSTAQAFGDQSVPVGIALPIILWVRIFRHARRDTTLR